MDKAFDEADICRMTRRVWWEHILPTAFGEALGFSVVGLAAGGIVAFVFALFPLAFYRFSFARTAVAGLWVGGGITVAVFIYSFIYCLKTADARAEAIKELQRRQELDEAEQRKRYEESEVRRLVEDAQSRGWTFDTPTDYENPGFFWFQQHFREHPEQQSDQFDIHIAQWRAWNASRGRFVSEADAVDEVQSERSFSVWSYFCNKSKRLPVASLYRAREFLELKGTEWHDTLDPSDLKYLREIVEEATLGDWLERDFEAFNLQAVTSASYAEYLNWRREQYYLPVSEDEFTHNQSIYLVESKLAARIIAWQDWQWAEGKEERERIRGAAARSFQAEIQAGIRTPDGKYNKEYLRAMEERFLREVNEARNRAIEQERMQSGWLRGKEIMDRS
ncbi:hypothetical protein JXA32_16355 [Candidatus Sumerlaeota bacterium]|nr:hypothetical protein [Candidatus Sumerlaeota bacterium]